MARSAYCTDVAVRGDIAFDRGCSVQCASLIAPYGQSASGSAITRVALGLLGAVDIHEIGFVIHDARTISLPCR
jgi:hypothetical protein